MATLDKTVGILFKAKDEASAVTAQLAKGLESVGGSASGSAKGVDELGSSTEKLAKSKAAVLDLGDALKTLAASLVVKAFIDANVEAEKFERAMTLLKGSSEAAGAEFQYISGVARTLGLNLFDTADAYVQLTAATKGTALEGDATRDVFEAVSKAMSSLGKSSADTQGALLAISQIVSKGTVSMEELRGQLGERLPGAFQIAAKSMGVTTAELDKLVSSGKLSAEEFLPKFAAALRDTFGDTTFVDGYAASFARLQNSISEAFISVGNAGTFDLLTKGINTAAAAVSGAVSAFTLLGDIAGTVAGALATGDFSGVGTAIADAMGRAGDRTQFAWQQFQELVGIAGQAETAVASAGQGVNLFAADVAKYEESQKAAAAATDKASESSKAQVKALADEAKERQRAEDAARSYALELEKLASNQRIKLIEAKVTLDIANIEANTQRVLAAFDSINATMASTENVLGDIFGLFTSLDNLDSSARNALFRQLDIENDMRQKAFELQRELTEAQVAVLRAQVKASERGDAFIKIDGAGLQPHLEAFMWEILKAIQTRVNAQGLKLLLGV